MYLRVVHAANSTCLVFPPGMLVRPCLRHYHMRELDIDKGQTRNKGNITSWYYPARQCLGTCTYTRDA